jgi:hypothetical protein
VEIVGDERHPMNGRAIPNRLDWRTGNREVEALRDPVNCHKMKWAGVVVCPRTPTMGVPR